MWNLWRPAAFCCIFLLLSSPPTLLTFFCLSLAPLAAAIHSLSFSFAIPLWESFTNRLPFLLNWFFFPLLLTAFFSCHCPAVLSPLHLYQFVVCHNFPHFLLFYFYFLQRFFSPPLIPCFPAFLTPSTLFPKTFCNLLTQTSLNVWVQFKKNI